MTSIIRGLWFLMAVSACLAQEEDPLVAFVQGTYDVVGRKALSNSTYSGRLTVKAKADGKLEIVRSILGEAHVTGSGRIESAVDGVKVLKIGFRQENTVYEGTFLIHSDLDNFGRLSGYVYPTERYEGKILKPMKQVDKPGIEAWFIAHDN